jgi:hypothetical protein
LDTWLEDNASSQRGLSENNLDNDLYNKIAGSILLDTSINENHFVINDGSLALKDLDAN